MKKFISIILVFCLVLSCGVLFASCKKDESVNESQVETYVEETTDESDESEETEVVYVYVTDSNGEKVTDKNGNPVTESAKKKETEKTTKFTYEVKGGSDPYVEDIWG